MKREESVLKTIIEGIKAFQEKRREEKEKRAREEKERTLAVLEELIEERRRELGIEDIEPKGARIIISKGTVTFKYEDEDDDSET